MKEEKCLGFLWEAEREGENMCVLMHGKVVRLSEKLIQGKPIHPDFETLRHKGGGGGGHQYH